MKRLRQEDFCQEVAMAAGSATAGEGACLAVQQLLDQPNQTATRPSGLVALTVTGGENDNALNEVWNGNEKEELEVAMPSREEEEQLTAPSNTTKSSWDLLAFCPDEVEITADSSADAFDSDEVAVLWGKNQDLRASSFEKDASIRI